MRPKAILVTEGKDFLAVVSLLSSDSESAASCYIVMLKSQVLCDR
jgi:hypothetical protein